MMSGRAIDSRMSGSPSSATRTVCCYGPRQDSCRTPSIPGTLLRVEENLLPDGARREFGSRWGKWRGKSTLLSLIAGLVPPDRGACECKRAGLPRSSTSVPGFTRTLPVRKNVRLNAALLGINRKRLNAIFADIVDFAELADFMSEPLRTYSSGMIMRLAFSVAVNVDPDILLIDEVLAVGDHEFQAKCFEKSPGFSPPGKDNIVRFARDRNGATVM